MAPSPPPTNAEGGVAQGAPPRPHPESSREASSPAESASRSISIAGVASRGAVKREERDGEPANGSTVPVPSLVARLSPASVSTSTFASPAKAAAAPAQASVRTTRWGLREREPTVTFPQATREPDVGRDRDRERERDRDRSIGRGGGRRSPTPPGRRRGPPPAAGSSWGPPLPSSSSLRDRPLPREREWERERPSDRDIDVEDIDAMRAQQRYGKDAHPGGGEPALTPRSSLWANAANRAGGGGGDWGRDRERDRDRDRDRGSSSSWIGGPSSRELAPSSRRSRSPPPGRGPSGLGIRASPSGSGHLGTPSHGFGGRRPFPPPPAPLKDVHSSSAASDAGAGSSWVAGASRGRSPPPGRHRSRSPPPYASGMRGPSYSPVTSRGTSVGPDRDRAYPPPSSARIKDEWERDRERDRDRDREFRDRDGRPWTRRPGPPSDRERDGRSGLNSPFMDRERDSDGRDPRDRMRSGSDMRAGGSYRGGPPGAAQGYGPPGWSRWSRSSAGERSPPHSSSGGAMRQWGIKRESSRSSRSPPPPRSPPHGAASVRSYNDADDGRPAHSPTALSRPRSPIRSPMYAGSSAARRASLVHERSPVHPDDSGPAQPSITATSTTAATLGEAPNPRRVQSPVTQSVAQYYSAGGRADSEEQDADAGVAALDSSKPGSTSGDQAEAPIQGRSPKAADQKSPEGERRSQDRESQAASTVPAQPQKEALNPRTPVIATGEAEEVGKLAKAGDDLAHADAIKSSAEVSMEIEPSQPDTTAVKNRPAPALKDSSSTAARLEESTQPAIFETEDVKRNYSHATEDVQADKLDDVGMKDVASGEARLPAQQPGSPPPGPRSTEPVSPLFGLADAALGLLPDAKKQESGGSTATTSAKLTDPIAEAQRLSQPATSVEDIEMATLAVARTQAAQEILAPAPVAEPDVDRIEVPSLGITLSSQTPVEDEHERPAETRGPTPLQPLDQNIVDMEVEEQEGDATSPPPIVLELTEEEREQRMRSALLKLGKEMEPWQADVDDIIHRNRRIAKKLRAQGQLPAGVPLLAGAQEAVDIWLVESDDAQRRAEQQAHFAQLQADIFERVKKDRVLLTAKIERLKREYLSIDRSWQQHCNRLQRLEERRESRDPLPIATTPYSTMSNSQSQIMQSNASGPQRRPAMSLSLSAGPQSAGGMGALTASTPLPDDYVTNPLSARGNRRGGASGFPGFGDAVRSEAEFLEILASLENADMQDPNARAARTTATVPDLILTVDGPPGFSNYDDDNGYVADPVGFFFDEFDPDVWTEEEKAIFERKYALWPKQFGRIAAGIPGKTRAQCVRYYYLNKKQPGSNFKAIAAARSRERKRKKGIKPKKVKGSALMADLKVDDVGEDEDPTESRGEPADTDMGDESLEGQSSGKVGTPTSPPLRKKRKEDGTAADGSKKAKSKSKKDRNRKPKNPKTTPSSPADPTPSGPAARGPFGAEGSALAPIGEHEESELAAAEMLNALAGIVTSPQAAKSFPLPSVDDNKPAKKKRKTVKPETPGQTPPTSVDPALAAGQLASKRPRQSTSSYWSIDEKNEFLRSLAANGKEWNVVSSTLQTKSAAQARNYYMRNADDPDFVEASRLGEANATLSPAAREAAATAFHDRRIADGAPVGVGTGRVQAPMTNPAIQAQPGSDDAVLTTAPAAHRGFQITNLLNEQLSRPDSRSSSAPFSSQAGRDDYGEAVDGSMSARRGPPSTDDEDTDEDDFTARQAMGAQSHEYPLHPPVGQAYQRQDPYVYAPRPLAPSPGQGPVSSAYGMAPAPARPPLPGYSYAPLPSGERSSVPDRDAMPPPSLSRRYESQSPAVLGAHGSHQYGEEGDRLEYGRGSTPLNPQSPDMERRQPLYPERAASGSWSAASTAPLATSQARSSSVRYTPAPLGRGYSGQDPSQSPPLRAIHSASPVAALSSSAPSAHSPVSAMQPPLSRPAYVAYRSTSASLPPTYSSNQHGNQADMATDGHAAHGHSISRLMSRSPEHVPAHRGSGYPPLSHAHQMHAPSPHSHPSSLPHATYGATSPGGYSTVASVRSSAMPRGSAASLSAPPRAGTTPSTSSAGSGPPTSSAYSLSGSRGPAPTLPSIHSLGAPGRLLSTARPSTATSLESPYGQLSSSHAHSHAHAHGQAHGHTQAHAHSHMHSQHQPPTTSSTAYSAHMQPPPTAVLEGLRRSHSPGGSSGHGQGQGQGQGQGYPSTGSHLHHAPHPHAHAHTYAHGHAHGHAHAHSVSSRGQSAAHHQPMDSASSSSSNSPRASPFPAHGHLPPPPPPPAPPSR